MNRSSATPYQSRVGEFLKAGCRTCRFRSRRLTRSGSHNNIDMLPEQQGRLRSRSSSRSSKPIISREDRPVSTTTTSGAATSSTENSTAKQSPCMMVMSTAVTSSSIQTEAETTTELCSTFGFTSPKHDSQDNGSQALFLKKQYMNYEQRFSCPICFEAKLEMVYGLCQHRICSDCLYTKKALKLKASMRKCPLCLMAEAFPKSSPKVPEDNVELQRCLGVRHCPFRKCKFQAWKWEMVDHVKTCKHRLQPLRSRIPVQTATTGRQKKKAHHKLENIFVRPCSVQLPRL